MGDFRSRYDVVGCVTADRMKQQVQNKFPALRSTPAEVSHTTLGKRNLLSFDSRGKKTPYRPPQPLSTATTVLTIDIACTDFGRYSAMSTGASSRGFEYF